jgi:hypothetical protein
MPSFTKAISFASVAAGLAGAASSAFNLSAASGGVEAAAGTRWLAASFVTETTNTMFTGVTLKLSAAAVGVGAQLDVYIDGGLEPGTLGTVSSIPTSLSDVTWNNGLTLQASRTYWLVMKAAAGTVNWSWKTANAGTRAGFTQVRGSADDGAAASWWTSDIYPTQITVTAAPCSSPSIGTPPAAAVAACGSTATLTVSASATTGMTYRWRRNSTPLADGGHVWGATSASLTIASLTGADAGSYDVVVSTSCGPARSLAVRSADVGSQGGILGGGGSLNNNDFVVFIDAFLNNLATAGLGSQGAVFGSDGVLDNNDFAVFIDLFFSGCE